MAKRVFCSRWIAAAASTAVGVWMLTATVGGCTASTDEPAVPAAADGLALPAGISADDYTTAEDQFRAKYGRDPSEADVYSWLGESSFRDGRWKVALSSFEQIPSDTPRYGHIARLYQGRTLLKLYRAQEAEKNLREFLKLEEQDPQLPDVHFAEGLLQLQYLLAIELRPEERKAILESLVKLGAADPPEVLNYCFPTLHRWNGAQAAGELEKFWQQYPDNPRLRVALGRYRTGQGRLDEARVLLEECRRDYPESVSTAAALLACLHEQDDWPAMGEIVKSLPPPEDGHPWLLLRMRGLYHNHRSEFAEALDCFERVLKLNESDVEAWMGKAAACRGPGDVEGQQRSLETARELSRIQNRIGWVLNKPDDPNALLEIAEIAANIELKDEALLTAKVALKMHPGHEGLSALKERLEPIARPE